MAQISLSTNSKSVPESDLFLGRKLILDPRTVTVVLITANVVALSPHSPFPLVVSLAVVIVALLLCTKRYLPVSRYLGALVIFAALLGLGYLKDTGPIAATLGLIGYYFFRFAVLFGAGMFLLYSSTPTELIAALRRLHLPNFLLIPLAVMMRFIPTIMGEGRHILDSMRLRRVLDSSWKVLLHPIKAIEHLVVPLMSSALRIGEDLSASALLRGLGTTKHPTTISYLGFKVADAFVIIICLAEVGLWIYWEPFTTWMGAML